MEQPYNKQKRDVHQNPVVAGLFLRAEDYGHMKGFVRQYGNSKDETIISQLESNISDKGRYGTTNSSVDARKVFQFGAENTDVEWAIGGFKTGKNNTYLVSTSQIMNEVTAPWKFGQEGLNYGNLFYAGHTHPYTREMQSHDIILSKPYIYNFIYYTGSGTKKRENYFVPFHIGLDKNGAKTVSPKLPQTGQIKLPKLIPF